VKPETNKNSINPLKSERPDIRAPSKRCLSGVPAPSKVKGGKSAAAKKTYVPSSDVLPARYDDYAVDCTAVALARTFISQNLHSIEDGWVAPSAIDELNSIYATVIEGATFGGAPFRAILEANRRMLFVGIVEICADHVTNVMVAGGKGFGWSDSEFPCYAVDVLLSATNCSDHKTLEVPVSRRNIAFKKFSLPKNRNRISASHISGPYLAVAAYEPESGVVARVRLFPVWYSSFFGRMSVVRSGLERTAAAAFAKNGSAMFTLVTKRQLKLLQDGLGHRWDGDVGSYPFQPDFLPMPILGRKPILAELFGMRNIKRYDESKSRKKAAGNSNSAIRFVYLEGAALSHAAVEGWVADTVRNAENGIWCRRSVAT
jgi:hypothetical protein